MVKISSRGEALCVIGQTPLFAMGCCHRLLIIIQEHGEESAKVPRKKGVETVMQHGGYSVGGQLACSAVVVCHPKRQCLP